ncbi:TMV resistance protein N [Vitis vinifera]|uniref:TMV resistance protein N n=1 Tax=Vitis vinifera TaxID=29760 RepID=A0A438EC18_VITVI|nr:TMV resistance protein N [Vitis vinifera]
MFIGYAENSVAYRFLVTKSENNLVDVNTIIETKNADFFENIFPMKLNMKIPKKVKSKNSVATASFFGLRSLRKLNLSDCHILEGAIPNDFSSLCSLEYLDLSRNNFVTLPARLNQLSQLKGLRLGCCKRLQSLPELPSSIEEIDAHDGTVMENILCPSSVYRSKECGGLRFTFSNCFRLSENESSNFVAATLREMQSLANKLPRFQFPIQPTEYRLHSNMVHLPPNWCNTRLMGLAVCAIFVVMGAAHDCPGNIFCHLNLTQGKTGHLFAPINPEHQNSSDEGHRFIH